MTQTYLSTKNGQADGASSWHSGGRVFPPLSRLLGTTNSNVKVFPELAMTRSEEAIHLTAYVPGVEKEEIELSIEDRDLTISGHRVLAVSEEDVLAEERFYGSFKRVVRLPEPVDVEQVEARHEDGVLHMTFPRLKANLKKTIRIQ